jgi:phosphatidylethanolamine/phosphatidyl-N-methylethanolamine N-methyltransferase
MTGGSKRLGHSGQAPLAFLRQWLKAPGRMGAVAPSSRHLARAMAMQLGAAARADDAPVIELGGGTGSITQGLLLSGLDPSRLVVIERDPQLAGHLRARFPAVRVLCGDATALRPLLAEAGIDRAAGVVSGLPLLLFPAESIDRIAEGAFGLMPAGRPFVQFTYGLKSPLPAGHRDIQGHRAAFVARNLPPAWVWVYRLTPSRPAIP